MSISETKEYMSIDYNEDDALIQRCRNAAEAFLKNAGVIKLELESDSLYELAADMLTEHWFDNRGVMGEGKEIPLGLDSIIVQLRLR